MKNIPTDFHESADPRVKSFDQVVDLTWSLEVYYNVNLIGSMKFFNSQFVYQSCPVTFPILKLIFIRVRKF